MIRQTSIDTYYRIKNEGLLSRLRLHVYETLYEHGPLTQMETCRRLNSNRQDRSYMPRFAELERMEVIQVVGQRQCSITGNQVLLYDVTDKLPKPLEKRETAKQKIIRLEKEIYSLKSSMCLFCLEAYNTRHGGNNGKQEH